MYPWLIGGTNSIGGNSKAPTNLKSFSGGFVNMVFMVSSMLSGACATPEFLMYMNYFIGLEYGRDYHKNADQVVDLSKKQRTLDKMITDYFEQIVYSINQPTGARNFQAVFWNISYYDKFYFESLFENFVFPDGSKPDWDSLSWLQKRFNAINCICFMGGDSEPDEVDRLAVHLRRSIKQPIKTAWYSGKQNIPKSCNLHNFDYIKLGAYIEELGGLDSPKTNQRLYKITNEQMEDITNHFQKQKQ